MKKAIYLVTALLLLTACATTEPFTLEPWPLQGNDLYVDRGQAVLTSSDGEVSVSVSMTMTSDYERLAVTVAVENLTGERYFLDDSQIILSSGDRDTGTWLIDEVWDASRFYSAEVREAERRQGTADALGAIAVFSSFADAAAPRRGGPGPGPRRGPDPVMRAAATSVIVSNETAAVARDNENYLSFLEANLLFDSHIAPGSTYTGVLYLNPDWSQPDYKLSFRSKDGSELSFIYSRSDR